ncbi:MAG: ABC transporter ATP-binding protein, partial [Candidatus Harrisonbacteria bacterium]|nr:ABC transporter ATP-binding protein [Candidatus Harrisonbacteria bacterium]
RASMEQLEEVFSTPREEKPADAVDPGPLKTVEFKTVSFSYAMSRSATLKDISVSISPGKTVAFVGPSGSGKSTLVKLLVGLYKPKKGDILWNGISGGRVEYEKIRNRIGLVLQETQLFSGTVRENLLFVRPQARDEQCLEVLRLAQIAQVFERSGEGLNTKIGEGGIKLSGGERQRLAIARALLRDPDMLIFDEATSSLDSMTESAITNTIKDILVLRPNLTTVLVAHRLSTIAHADTIYVLEKGRIIEEGTHDELLELSGLYAALWREQSAQRESGVSDSPAWNLRSSERLQ